MEMYPPRSFYKDHKEIRKPMTDRMLETLYYTVMRFDFFVLFSVCFKIKFRSIYNNNNIQTFLQRKFQANMSENILFKCAML